MLKSRLLQFGRPRLRENGASYLNDLLAQYDLTSGKNARNPEIAARVVAIKGHVQNGKLTWADVHFLELTLIELWPIEQVKYYLIFLRGYLSEALGEARY